MTVADPIAEAPLVYAFLLPNFAFVVLLIYTEASALVALELAPLYVKVPVTVSFQIVVPAAFTYVEVTYPLFSLRAWIAHS